MDWLEEVKEKQKRKNKILFSKDSSLFSGLITLIERKERFEVALWALDLAEEAVAELEKLYPEDTRPRTAVYMAREWAAGRIKMRAAQRAILDCHAGAKETDDAAGAALYHATAQACSTVHTIGHALGFPIYELTAVVLRLGIDSCRNAVESRVKEYETRLLETDCSDYSGSLADFLK